MKSAGEPPADFCLYQLLFVDDQLELQAELFRRLTAQDHALHENLKILHDRAEPGIHCQFQFYKGFILVDF